jgi:hypothetical protein
VKLVPDTAYLAQPLPADGQLLAQLRAREGIKPGTVGIVALPRKQSTDVSGWGKIIQTLWSRGKEVIFLSHQMLTDEAVGRELQARYGIKVLSKQYEYHEYINILSLLEFIISERYHTCVFSAIAGTPFIPLKVGRLSKMNGVVWFLDYQVPPVDTASSDWADVVQKYIVTLERDRHLIEMNLRETMPRLRVLVEENIRCGRSAPVESYLVFPRER